MIYCFLEHVSCFICVSSLNLHAFYAFCHVSFLDLHPYMLICLDLHALGFMPCFPIFYASSCSKLMLGLHGDMLYDVVGYVLLGSMCLCVYFHDI